MTNALSFILSEERRYASIPYTETGTNHQRFSNVVSQAGLMGCQSQPWCATYQFALEVEAFGKDEALKHWCMTASSYRGYSCFETEAAFKAKGKTGKIPKVGALVIFTRSHMGRVLSINSTQQTFECGEGNTSNKQYDRNGDSCAVKTYAWNDAGIRSFCYIDYGDDTMTADKLVKAAKAVYEMAHNGGYRYGDSHALPPCADGIISCDRLIARALYNLGYTSQPNGGITVLNMESYLLKWGFKKIQPNSGLKAGDIVLMKQNGETKPSAAWHAFIVTAVTVSGTTTRINKYDMGSQDRIRAAQPFTNVLVNEWASRSVYAIFRCGSGGEENYLDVTPEVLSAGTKSKWAYKATEILQARGCKGITDKTTGQRKELQNNFEWTIGDMTAAAEFRVMRACEGQSDLVKENAPAGNVTMLMWQVMFGGGFPFRLYPVPEKQTKGLTVLKIQETLRARDILGADGKPLKLDREWGANTEFAFREYQRRRGGPVDGKCSVKWLKDMFGL